MALKKGDLRFHVQSVRLASRWKATRYAVFSSILSQAWKEKGVPWAFDMLYLLWRQRLDELRAEGWVPIQDDTNFTYIRNCPPFGVKTPLQYQRRCKRKLLCPFCYARDFVLKAFIHLEKYAFGGMDPTTDGTGWKEKPERLRMVEYSHRTSIRADDVKYTPEAIESVCCNIIKRYLAERDRRRREFDLLQGDCGVSLVRVAPIEGRLRLWISGIVLTRRAAGAYLRPAESDKKTYRYTDHKEWDKTTLARACGRVFSYPKAMFTAQPPDVIAMLDGLRRVRMLSRYRRSTKVDLKKGGGP